MTADDRNREEQRDALRPVLRVVVAVDTTPERRHVCEVAAALAAGLEAELVGQLLEDINLLRSAELPNTRELGASTARVRPYDATSIESQLRVRARRARQLFEAIARQSRVTWTFEVMRTLAPFRAGRPSSARAMRPPIKVLVPDGDGAARAALEIAGVIAAREGRTVETVVAAGDTLEAVAKAVGPCHLLVVARAGERFRRPEELTVLAELAGVPVLVVD